MDNKIIGRFKEEFSKALKDFCESIGLTLYTQVEYLNYRIDFFIDEIDLAIEYDEEYHKYTTEQDKKREQAIKEKFNCDILRLNHKDNDSYNLGLVTKMMLKKKGDK